MPPETQAPAAPARTNPLLRKVSRRVKLADRFANFTIRTCGVGIIAIVTLIFVFIGLEALPLFRGAQQQQVFEKPLPGLGTTQPTDVLALGVDEYETHAYFVDAATGSLRIVDLATHATSGEFPLPSLAGTRATVAYRTPARDRLFIGTADGRVVLARVLFVTDYAPDGRRTVTARASEVGVVTVAAGAAITRVHGRQNNNGDYILAAATADARVFTARVIEDEPPEEPRQIGGAFAGAVTALIIDHEATRLMVADEAPRLHQYYLEEDPEAPFRSYAMTARITALDWAIGDNALLLGFANGAVESWFGVREQPTDVLKPLRRIHVFKSLPATVTAIQPSARDKGFAVGAADGTVHLDFTTSERTLLEDRLAAGVRHFAYAPKLTALLTLDAAGSLRFTRVHNPHPEVSLRTLFGKVHYENYDEPSFTWQSTGGTDDFESKLSLVPLLVGTLKGAFYGLFFAIPIAVFAALYTSQFMSPALRRTVKPTVEIMAALPSVVIGFLAGLWLAPKLEEAMVGTLLALPIVPLLVLAGAAGWMMLPRSVRARVPEGWELFLAVPLVAVGAWLALQLGPWVEATLMAGDYKQWAYDVFGKQVEQRNSIVIGIALGFAVIPVIFTISEDAFSNVPATFRSASYALGASRWQTAWRVILPTASPGVFSAVMIGFGRAVGETMIVLMATGNTPILSLSPFNGMRTLSANIAVEIPEAPAGGTLYRVLFISALLLFALTFLCNTIAEVVRQRLRQKYQAV
ncbi:MAG: ABC transporter permease subunit [Opitutaceae bacterium]|nr:ABC transporter permease subunit [Opitutaceae bacterium]